MASHAPITGAPTCASVLNKTIDAFEDVAGKFSTLFGVIRAADESRDNPHLITAAAELAELLDKSFVAAVNQAYADRAEVL